MIEIPVPEQLFVPEPTAGRGNIVETRDFLLTRLLRHDAGLLHADWRATQGRLFVKAWTKSSETEDVVYNFDGTPARARGVLRSVLACFGATLGGGEMLYGGHAEGHFTQAGWRHLFSCYTANDSWRGYWLRCYVRRCEQG